MGHDHSDLLFILILFIFGRAFRLHRFTWAFSSCSKPGGYLYCVAWLLLLQSRDSRHAGTGVVAVGPGVGSGVMAVGPGSPGLGCVYVLDGLGESWP